MALWVAFWLFISFMFLRAFLSLVCDIRSSSLKKQDEENKKKKSEGKSFDYDKFSKDVLGI